MVGGVVGGLPASPPPAPLRVGGNINAQATAAELGELFEYKLEGRVSIPQNRSAMVPIVSAPVTAERVSLWNRSEAGTRPRRALWLTNSSGLTLDAGTVAVIDPPGCARELCDVLDETAATHRQPQEVVG